MITQRFRFKSEYWPYFLVMVLSIAYALGFFTIYLQPHSYEQASQWIYAHIPAGSKLIGVHWDDRLPLSLPGLDSNRFDNVLELPLYEPDTPTKLQGVTARLSKGDYLILPTMRLPGSLLRVPSEFRQMASFFGQLYSGSLGFKLIKTFDIEPRFPFAWDPSSADESFSVYDHPKVSIFKNVEKLSQAELQRRIYDPPKIMPALDQVMKLTEYAIGESLPQPRSTVVQIIIWMVLLELMGLAFFPLCALAFKNLPDRGYGASKACGLFLFATLVWLLGNLKLWQSNGIALGCLLLLLLLVGHLTCKQYFGGWRRLFEQSSTTVITVELFALGVFIFFASYRSLSPEIFWGEKPMDFTFLNYFSRTPNLPPNDPWAAGQAMHYYYLGSFGFAQLIKLGQIDPAVGYNLSLASIPMLAVCAAFSLFGYLGIRPKLAALLSAALIFVSDFEVLKLWIFDGKPLNFDLFWASTRLFTSPGITEYPLWSIIFADLHAHLMALPLALVCLLLACQLLNSSLRNSNFRGYLAIRIFLGIVWGTVFLLNSWDFITYGVVILVFSVAREYRALAGFSASLIIRSILCLLLDGLIISTATLLITAPFLVSSAGAIHSSFGWVQTIEFNTASQIFRLLGHWILLALLATLLIFAGLILRTESNSPRATWLKEIFSKQRLMPFLLCLVTSSSPFIMGLLSALAGNNPPWGVLSIATLIIILGVGLASARGNANKAALPTALALIVAGFLIAFAELRFVNDHMNTIFKFYNQIWILLGFGALGTMPYALSAGATLCHSQKGTWSYRAVCGLMGGVLLLAAISSLLNLTAMATFRRTKNEVPSLVGNQYLQIEAPDEARAIAWINTHIKGLPVLLEAFGPGYQAYSRFAMHTGLPLVLGWDYHVMQRGVPWEEIEQRKRDIKNIYTSADENAALALLQKYNVKLVVLGDLERKTYGAKAGLSFARDTVKFTEVFRSGTLTLYRVN